MRGYIGVYIDVYGGGHSRRTEMTNMHKKSIFVDGDAEILMYKTKKLLNSDVQKVNI